MRSVEVYTHPGCPGGDSAIQFLKERSIPYRVYNVVRDSAALGRLRAWGCRETPVIVLDDRIMCGFDPDWIERGWRGEQAQEGSTSSHRNNRR